MNTSFISNGMTHSTLGASSASRWVACPGSVALCAKLPRSKGSKYSAEGTAAHELGERCLLQNKNPEDFAFEEINGFEVTDEMIEAVKVYVDFVRETAGKNPINVEAKFSLEWIFPGMFGTNDASSAEPFGALHVFDYKHGAGVPVEVEDNIQLLYYAIGAAYNKEMGDFDDYDKVVIHIIQPRAPHSDGTVRSWETTVDYLREKANELKVAAEKTRGPNAELNPTDKGCRWCDAKTICPAIVSKAMDTAKLDFSPVAVSPVPALSSLTTEDVVKLIKHEKLILDFIGAVKEKALSDLIGGQEIPGLKLVRGRGSRAWNLPTDEIEDKLTSGDFEAFNPGNIFTKKIISPAQAEKLVKSKEEKEALKALYSNLEGSVTVATEDDKRKAVKPSPELDFEPVSLEDEA